MFVTQSNQARLPPALIDIRALNSRKLFGALIPKLNPQMPVHENDGVAHRIEQTLMYQCGQRWIRGRTIGRLRRLGFDLALWSFQFRDPSRSNLGVNIRQILTL